MTKEELEKTTGGLREYYIIPKNSTWIVDGIDVQVALEQQIPQAPTNITQEHAWAELVGRCPICKGFVREPWGSCAWCGKKLDWGDQNERY